MGLSPLLPQGIQPGWQQHQTKRMQHSNLRLLFPHSREPLSYNQIIFPWLHLQKLVITGVTESSNTFSIYIISGGADMVPALSGNCPPLAQSPGCQHPVAGVTGLTSLFPTLEEQNGDCFPRRLRVKAASFWASQHRGFLGIKHPHISLKCFLNIVTFQQSWHC